jgi:RNase P protein component
MDYIVVVSERARRLPYAEIVDELRGMLREMNARWAAESESS